MRQGNRWDGILGGYKFRLKRGEEASYTKLVARSEGIPFQENTETRGQFSSRGDVRTFFQTAWVGGAFWNKPLISAASIESYYISDGFDFTSTPGEIAPLATRREMLDKIGVLRHGGAAVAVGGEIYAVGFADDSTNNILAKTSYSGWSTLNKYTNHFPTGADKAVVTLFYDQGAKSFVALRQDGVLDYVTKADDDNDTIASVGAVTHGSNAFMHFGRMMVYTGDKLMVIDDPYGSPAVETLHDDGNGPDFLSDISTSADIKNRLLYMPRLAVSTAEGVYYVKNIEQEGLPTAHIYRVDRTSEGLNIGTALATLPPGVIALEIAYHLGSLLISTSSDLHRITKNNLSDGGYPRIDIYHLTNGSMGTVGSPLGGTDVDEAPYRFCGYHGAKMYIGGQKRVWEYDAIEGGLHPLFTHGRVGSPGAAVMRAFASKESEGLPTMMFVDSEFAIHDYQPEGGVAGESISSIHAATHALAPQAEWRFNNLNDSSGNSHTLTNNGAVHVENGLTGADQSYHFTVPNYMTIAGEDALELRQDMTIEGWVLPLGDGTIISCYDASGPTGSGSLLYDLQFDLASTGPDRYTLEFRPIIANNSPRKILATDIVPGVWLYFAVSIDWISTTDRRIVSYVAPDGLATEQIGDTTYSYQPDARARTITIGGRGASLNFTGTISELNIYDKLLTVDQMRDQASARRSSATMESIYFDFNIPAEKKTITYVTLMTDTVQTGERWTVSISSDDGPFIDVATFDEANLRTEKVRIDPQVGYRFQYRLRYETTANVNKPAHIKGVVFHSLQGEMVTRWQLSIDGTEFSNIENRKQRPEDVLAWAEEQAANASTLEFVDQYKDGSSTHRVRIDSASIDRTAPQEIDKIQIVLTEDT